MTKDNAKATDGNGQGLPPPFNWVAGFIDKYFIKMPKPVQVTVFLLFVIYFIVGTVRFFAPEVWDILWSQDVEIRGVLTKPNWGEVVDSSNTFFLSGNKLYVTKDHPNPNTAPYHFRWILKVPRTELERPVVFAFMDGPLEMGKLRTKASELLSHRKDNEVKLALFEHELAKKVEIDFVPDTTRENGASLNIIRWSETASTWLLGSPQIRRLSNDSAVHLLKLLVRPGNAAAQLQIRGTLAESNTYTMKIVADSVRESMNAGRTSTAAMYALALSDFDSLYLFSTSPDYSKTFDERFYEKAADLIGTGNEAERNYIATLLHNLQDSRCLKAVFNTFERSVSVGSKEMCLYVIEAFARNDSSTLKKMIRSELQRLQNAQSAAPVGAAIQRTISRLDSPRRR